MFNLESASFNDYSNMSNDGDGLRFMILQIDEIGLTIIDRTRVAHCPRDQMELSNP
jgi:hypothetical protein